MKRLAFLFATAVIAASPIAVPAAIAKPAATADYAVGAQYDTTHVYVPQDQFDTFVASFVATFGGTTSKQGEFQVTPTKSLTKSQLVLTPAGTVSVFGFKTPIPYPFGDERTGYLVTDLDAAVKSAVSYGAVRRLETFPDPIGRDSVIQWPGGVNMQLYWHTAKPSYTALETVPENRIYLTVDAADTFIKSWTGFAHAKITADDKAANGAEIGEPGKAIRRVAITSGYGKMVVYVSDGQLPWPYGRDMTGYAVNDLNATLAKASAAGVETLVAPYTTGKRQAAMVRFPGGYIAEIHSGEVNANEVN
ncbi:MAG: glyoxalase [Novosphingobium pentaromativorans]|uniref:Glyoxalase n=1 Tax=Novosphingobium pentaromativorans TaxID=205844 RepID=A0A2W5QHT1_9SPHN|nr:glyoxalase [Novosphingobium panipatense]PZQ51080.1 MAG: glyoxalase [Novosphingobium pentaromativorans]